MNMADLEKEARRLSDLLDKAISASYHQSELAASAEREYRLAKSEAWATTAGKEMLAKEREAKVDALTADLRYERDLADSLRRGAIEAERSRRQQISLIQTQANAYAAEAKLAATAPEYTP